MTNAATQHHPVTGFIEHPAYVYDFDSDRKLQYIALIRQGYGKYKACDLLRVKDATVFHHIKIDVAFADAIKEAERDYFDTLESVSRTNALEPKMVIERIFQLKNRFPDRYGDNKNTKQEISILFDVGTAHVLIDKTRAIDIEQVSNEVASAPSTVEST